MRLRTLALSCLVTLALVGCSDANQSAAPDDQAAAPEGQCDYPADAGAAKQVDPPPTQDVATEGQVTATMHMTAGDVTLTLDREQAPCTVNSFVSLAEQGFYDDTVCHRLVDTGIFILQCGDPTGTGRGGPGYVVDDELSGHETYPAGTVAMANTGAADSNGSQFFFVWEDSPLPPKYTVFGTLDTASLAVIQDIGAQGVSGEDETTPIAKAEISSVTLG